ncbi:MAG: S1C family serine protease [Fimbriiglobus sp.]
MSARPFRLLIAGFALAVWSPAGLAADRGKDRLAKLFAEPASAAAESTVRVKCNDKPAALGVVVAADGLILTKASELRIVAADGLILTKASELRGEITCLLADGTAYDATYVGYHKPTDLALLRIDAKGLKVATFAVRSAVEVGNFVASVDHNADPIAVGVVGTTARKLYDAEAAVRNSNKGYLGILLEDPVSGDGVLVGDLIPKGAAEKAGVAVRDVIHEISGKPAKDRVVLAELLESYRPGDAVTVRVRRGNKQLSLKVVLGDRPKERFGRGESTRDRNETQNAMGGLLSARRTGFPAVIQHDGYVKPTDIGGPVVDVDGKLIGMNIARAGRVETWALPGDVIQSALTELKSGKHPAP